MKASRRVRVWLTFPHWKPVEPSPADPGTVARSPANSSRGTDAYHIDSGQLDCAWNQKGPLKQLRGYEVRLDELQEGRYHWLEQITNNFIVGLRRLRRAASPSATAHRQGFHCPLRDTETPRAPPDGRRFHTKTSMPRGHSSPLLPASSASGTDCQPISTAAQTA